MKVTDYISNMIDRLPKGYVFTYKDFDTDVRKKEIVIKVLNRMANSGKITKLAKGKYFKPERTPIKIGTLYFLCSIFYFLFPTKPETKETTFYSV